MREEKENDSRFKISGRKDSLSDSYGAGRGKGWRENAGPKGKRRRMKGEEEVNERERWRQRILSTNITSLD